MKLAQRRRRRWSPFLVFMMVVLLVSPLSSWPALLAEDAPPTEEGAVPPAQAEAPATDPPPAPTDAPAPPTTQPPPPPPTDPPTTDPPATDPPATDSPVATESPATVEPTEEAPVTEVPTEWTVEAPPTEAQASEEPTSETSPTATQTPTPTEEGIEREPAMMSLAVASSAMLTVDGQSGVVYVERGGTQTFQVGDVLDMASLVPDFINASNPDPDFYNFNGWWTSNTFNVYSSQDCSGSVVRYFYTDTMMPGTAIDTATMSGAVRTYSVQAVQYLRIWWLERRIDIVDTVDETWTFPVVASSNCVTVNMTVDYINLLANGSTGPVTVGETDPIGLQTTQPTGDGWTQILRETDSDCVHGTQIAVSGPGETVSATITRPPGTYWFMVLAWQGSDTIYTNCVQVTVQQTAAELFVEGGKDPVTFITGQALSYYVRGFSPNAAIQQWTYLSNTNCPGYPNIVANASVGSDGTASLGEIANTVGYSSIKFVSFGVDGEVVESTNCVILLGTPGQIDLTVNGSRGPVLAMVDDELLLRATGLPPGALAYVAIGCEGPFTPDDFGSVIGPDGVLEASLVEFVPDEFNVRVVLEPPSTVSSNCVSVRLIDYVIEPRLTVNGSETPAAVAYGGQIDIAVEAFPPDVDAVVHAFPGSGDCGGEPVPTRMTLQNDGSQFMRLEGTRAGPVSYRVVAGTYESNCVAIEVLPAPTEEPTEPVTEVPTGPITLLANGAVDPVVVAGGTKVDLTAQGVGEGEPYTVRWYPAGDCTGTPRMLASGTGATGLVGAMTRYVASTVGMELTAGDRTSNCVQVGWLAIPPTEVPTDVPTVVPTIDPTDPVTEEPTEPVTEPSTEEPTEPATEMPTEPVTVEPTDPATEAPTDPVTEAPTEPSTEEPTEPVTEEPTEPVTVEPTDPATEQPTEPETEVPTDPVTVEPSEEPTEQPTDPATWEPTDPVTQTPTDPVTEIPTEPATEPATGTPAGGSDGSTPSPGGPVGGGATTGGVQTGQFAGGSEPTVSRLPVTGATGGEDRSLFVLLALAATLFAGAGSLVSRGGGRRQA